MAMTISIDEQLKNEFSEVCREIGLTPSAAIGIFAKTVVREKGIPFELSSLSRAQRRSIEAEAEISRGIGASYDAYLRGEFMTREQLDSALDSGSDAMAVA